MKPVIAIVGRPNVGNRRFSMVLSVNAYPSWMTRRV